MAAHAAQQHQAAEDSEASLSGRLRQAESAQAASQADILETTSHAQRNEIAASIAKQALGKEQSALQDTMLKLHREQRKCIELQV